MFCYATTIGVWHATHAIDQFRKKCDKILNVITVMRMYPKKHYNGFLTVT